MYTRNELEEAIDTLGSEGWKVIQRHIEETIANYTDKLIESDDTEDERLKGSIQTLRRDILPLREEFRKMLEVKVSEAKKK